MSDKNTIARPYARAIFEIAKETQQLPLWGGFLENLELIALNKDFNNLVDNPSFSAALALEVALDCLADTPTKEQEELYRVATFEQEDQYFSRNKRHIRTLKKSG